MMEIDFSILSTIPPFEGDEKINEKLSSIDNEINNLQQSLNKIYTDSIPFDKMDYWVMFLVATLEVAADIFISDPTTEWGNKVQGHNHKEFGSFSNRWNKSQTIIGKWCNIVHDNIDHSGNPLDFQNRFDELGNIIPNGVKHNGPTISFGGGDHRPRTYGHDLFYFWKAISMYMNGEFVDGGYINGEWHEVVSKIALRGQNNTVTEFEQMRLLDATMKYICHMFADFFSSKGLPMPGSGVLEHSKERALRQFSQDMYKEGMNIRTFFLQSVPIAVSEIMMRIYSHLKYSDSEYSDEAKKAKLHLMLLVSHGISTAINVGKVVITENPASLNLWMIVRTISLVLEVLCDKAELKHCLVEKVVTSGVISGLEIKKTLIILESDIYYTSNYQQLTFRIKEEYDKIVMQRISKVLDVTNLQEDLILQNMLNEEEFSKNNDYIERLSNELYYTVPSESLELLTDRQEILATTITDKEIIDFIEK